MARNRDTKWQLEIASTNDHKEPTKSSMKKQVKEQVKKQVKLIQQLHKTSTRKVELMSDRKLVHTMHMKIRWGDMDAFNHVNNTVYFRYMEQTRIDWFESMTVPVEVRGYGPVIINAHCAFLRQLKYPGKIEIRMYAKDPGRSSVETTYEIRRDDHPEVIYAEGGAKIVWVDFEAEKSVPLPDSIRRTLSDL